MSSISVSFFLCLSFFSLASVANNFKASAFVGDCAGLLATFIPFYRTILFDILTCFYIVFGFSIMRRPIVSGT
jgi:hypothetical protein